MVLFIFLVCLCNKVLMVHRDKRRPVILRLHIDMLKCSSVCSYKENAIGFGHVTTWLDVEKVCFYKSCSFHHRSKNNPEIMVHTGVIILAVLCHRV